MRRLALAITLWLGLVQGAFAGDTGDAGRVERLADALQFDRLIGVMEAEGRAYADEIARAFLGANPESWQIEVARVYEPVRMRAVVTETLARELGDADLAATFAFFETELGQRIVGLEIDAREAMLEPAIEKAARALYADQRGTGDARLAQITRFVQAGDLIEANVTGGLNTSLMFFRGFADGGGSDQSEADIVTEVWSQEPDLRLDSAEWIHAFSLLAYETLRDEEFDAYLAFSESGEGRALNRAIFAGFDAMYSAIAYGLGLAAARELQAQEL